MRPSQTRTRRRVWGKPTPGNGSGDRGEDTSRALARERLKSLCEMLKELPTPALERIIAARTEEELRTALDVAGWMASAG